MTRSGRRAPFARDDFFTSSQARPRGFTLVELLIALTLLGLVMVAVYGGLRLIDRKYNPPTPRCAGSRQLLIQRPEDVGADESDPGTSSEEQSGPGTLFDEGGSDQ